MLIFAIMIIIEDTDIVRYATLGGGLLSFSLYSYLDLEFCFSNSLFLKLFRLYVFGFAIPYRPNNAP